MRMSISIAMMCLLSLATLVTLNITADPVEAAVDTHIGVLGSVYTYNPSTGPFVEHYPIAVGDLVDVSIKEMAEVSGEELRVDLHISYAYEVAPEGSTDGICKWPASQLGPTGLSCWFISADDGLWEVSIYMTGAAPAGSVSITVSTSSSAYSPANNTAALQMEVSDLTRRVDGLDITLDNLAEDLGPIIGNGTNSSADLYQRITQLEIEKDEAIKKASELEWRYEKEKSDMQKEIDNTIYLAQVGLALAVMILILMSVLIGVLYWKVSNITRENEKIRLRTALEEKRTTKPRPQLRKPQAPEEAEGGMELSWDEAVVERDDGGQWDGNRGVVKMGATEPDAEDMRPVMRRSLTAQKRTTGTRKTGNRDRGQMKKEWRDAYDQEPRRQGPRRP